MIASAAGSLAEPGSRVRQKAGLNRCLRERALGELRALLVLTWDIRNRDLWREGVGRTPYKRASRRSAVNAWRCRPGPGEGTTRDTDAGAAHRATVALASLPRRLVAAALPPRYSSFQADA